MKTIDKIDSFRLQANKLRKIVNSTSETVSTDGMKSIVSRFKQAALLDKTEDKMSQISRLKSFSINQYLDLISRESGYENWATLSQDFLAQNSISAREQTELYRIGVSEFNFNIWCPSYEEAKQYLDTNNGYYLLQYKGNCFLAQASHIEGLGLSPNDPDWEKIGWDWVKPKDLEAKMRLQKKLTLGPKKIK